MNTVKQISNRWKYNLMRMFRYNVFDLEIFEWMELQDVNDVNVHLAWLDQFSTSKKNNVSFHILRKSPKHITGPFHLSKIVE